MEIESQKKNLLGTQIEIKLPGKFSYFFPKCFSRLREIENNYSRFIENSQLSSLNNNLGKWQTASSEFIFLLKKAAELNSTTEGHFDIALKTALDSLGYDKNYSFKKNKKTESPLHRAASFLQGNICIDEKNSKVLLNKQIDFGGFGKGFALDEVASLLEKNNIFHYYINAGGDIMAKSAPDEKEWQILLEHPDDDSRALGKISLNGEALAASAPNRRKWGSAHHLLNAKTGIPQNNAKCIFCLAKTGIEADAYATAIFCAGFEEGISLSKKLPVQILFVSAQNKVYKSEKFGAEIF
ncbi:hypothetical protein COU37_05540 [Candidatus Micrarchaeota archaeon CG10_big_fil_rev_8_21_14_0_10_45_29]|nr:MAG: hypothetical protein COU37_05540 [Candidatus Micrarchaeota archaeon CG10_big_fil_rev_8_21_14_0_10_45_29]